MLSRNTTLVIALLLIFNSSVKTQVVFSKGSKWIVIVDNKHKKEINDFFGIALTFIKKDNSVIFDMISDTSLNVRAMHIPYEYDFELQVGLSRNYSITSKNDSLLEAKADLPSVDWVSFNQNHYLNFYVKEKKIILYSYSAGENMKILLRKRQNKKYRDMETYSILKIIKKGAEVSDDIFW